MRRTVVRILAGALKQGAAEQLTRPDWSLLTEDRVPVEEKTAEKVNEEKRRRKES